MPDSSSHNQITLELLKYIGSFIVGAITFLIKEKYENRKNIFTKRIWGQRLGLTLQSDDWGDIQILYNGQPSNDLHIISAEIINSSNKDFSNLIFEFSVPKNAVIYKHQGNLVYDNLTKELLLEKAFHDNFQDVRTRHLATIQNQQTIADSLQNEINFITRHRRFSIPVIQSKTKAIFHFLVDDYGENPYLNVSILEPDIRTVLYQDETERKALKRKWSEYGGLLIFLILSYPIYKYSETVSTAISLMIINVLIASVIALGFYYLFVWLKKVTR